MKPESIVALEKEIGVALEPLHFQDVLSGVRGFVIDNQGRVKGLALDNVEIKSFAFLKAFPKLIGLGLSGTGFRDFGLLEKLDDLKGLALGADSGPLPRSGDRAQGALSRAQWLALPLFLPIGCSGDGPDAGSRDHRLF